MSFGRILLLLTLLTVGCVHPGPAERGVTVTPLSTPTFPLPPDPPVEEPFEPLVKCWGGDYDDMKGLRTNHMWLFSGQNCVMDARLTKEKMTIRANPRFSLERLVDVTVTVIYHRMADTIHVGINGSGDYERLSSFPKRGSQSIVEWEDIPPGIYSIWALATLDKEQVAIADVKVCYGTNMEDC